MTVRDLSRRDPGPKVAAHQREGDGVVRVPYPIGVRHLTVAARRVLTPRIVRITVAGPELAGFHSYQADDHVKLVFPDPDGTRRVPTPRPDADLLDWPSPFPCTRTYTVRRLDTRAGELDLDVVLHGEGPGSAWGRDAAVGDPVCVAGPPGCRVFPHHRSHHVFAVDETALPVVGRWMEEAPGHVTADVVIETGEASDHDYPLVPGPGVAVHRLVRAGTGSRLGEAVRDLARPDAFLVAAGEADALRPLRRAVRDGLAAGALVTGYWKRGVVDLDED
ncbi:siderophore-interacting protein [Actinomycetospora sp. OC33-EN08]|uniref:Siderophore-interacting protein n=1 Tax=Actinomycetospora aurantiaca TaxID=3129233 RepID=A0ABU8MUM7_9PSEU